MTKIKTLARRIRLWSKLVWREWEPASCGIPDPYRSHYRFSLADAWDVAKIIHPGGAKIDKAIKLW